MKSTYFLLAMLVLVGGGCRFAFEGVSDSQMQPKLGSDASPTSAMSTVDGSNGRTFEPATDPGGSVFPITFEIPKDWEVEFIPSIEALNLFTLTGEGSALERSQILIRYFDAEQFLTLSTVEIFDTQELTVGKEAYTARRYDIQKKAGVPDFTDQPLWRNGRHIVTDFRDADGFTRYFVVAANPGLDPTVYEQVLASMDLR